MPENLSPEEARNLSPDERQELREEETAAYLRGARLAGLTKKFYWNEAAGRYIDERGRFVEERVVRAAVDRSLEKSGAAIQRATNRLREGEITLAQWERVMRREVKNVHIVNGSLAAGGLEQMPGSTQRRIQALIEEQYEYLQGFVEDIQTGRQRMDGRVVQRAQMYTEAGRTTYHNVERYEKQKRGYNQERNRLGVAEHCEECVELTERGWVPNGSIPLVGDRICLKMCKCYIEYRKTEVTDPDEFPSIKGTPQAQSRR